MLWRWLVMLLVLLVAILFVLLWWRRFYIWILIYFEKNKLLLNLELFVPKH